MSMLNRRKRIIRHFYIICLLLTLAQLTSPISAMAGNDRDMPPALYPARGGDGLWGYIDRQGDWVIAPQWTKVTPFSGDYAAVTTASHLNQLSDGNALIDRRGNYVIEPQEMLRISETPHTWNLSLSSRTNNGVGFVDKASGFCLMPASGYTQLLNWYEDGRGPIPVGNADGNFGYLSRTTGEVVIPFRYDEYSENIGFVNGYANVAVSSGNGAAETDESTDLSWFLIDTRGTAVQFPDGIYPLTDVYMDRVLVANENGWGLARPDGTLVVAPQYDELFPPDDDGRIGFLMKHDDGMYQGFLDLDGNVIVPDRYRISTNSASYSLYPAGYANGYAVIRDYVSISSDAEAALTFVILDFHGQEIARLSSGFENGRMEIVTDVLKNGLAWYRVDQGKMPAGRIAGSEIRYGLLRISNGQVGYLTGAIYEYPYGGILASEMYDYELRFSEGLQPVRADGLWGYIDEQAEWVFPPAWDRAASFQNGLALVEKDDKLAYIDHEGKFIWTESGFPLPDGTEPEPRVIDHDESALRTLELLEDSRNRRYIRVTMQDTQMTVQSPAQPDGIWMDTYHDGDAILVLYALDSEAWFADGSGETYFVTFKYVDGTWRCTGFSNGWDFTADVSDGVYRFNDYYNPDPKWAWETAFDDRLETLHLEDLTSLAQRYNENMPDHPSLTGEWE